MGCLLSSHAMLKQFSGEKKFVLSKWDPKMTGFFGGGGMKAKTLDLRYATPKDTHLRGTAYYNVFCVKIGAHGSSRQVHK